MKEELTLATAIAAAMTTAAMTMPVQAQAQAQDTGLSDSQINFFSEMLAMGEVCGHVADFRVEREEMQDWVTSRLADEADSDLDAVLSQRDSKLMELEDNAAHVRDMSRGNARQRAVDEHYAGLVNRCQRLTNHSLAGEYFLKDVRQRS